ncbi:hypothetical protein EDD16DRAFT_1659707 [Pisolithus croceorrhizus]|nr:hypothetical protein EDD16DRAFT_1659707 [Pisolithus croceorrhizus]
MASLMVVRELHHDVNFHFPVREVENDSNTRTVRGFINSDPGSALYPIIDKTRSPSRSRSPLEANFAEALGYLITDTAHLKTEIGYITILPPFQSHTCYHEHSRATDGICSQPPFSIWPGSSQSAVADK